MPSESRFVKLIKQLGGFHLIVCSWIPFLYLGTWKAQLDSRASIFQYIFFALILILVLISTFSAMYTLTTMGNKE